MGFVKLVLNERQRIYGHDIGCYTPELLEKLRQAIIARCGESVGDRCKEVGEKEFLDEIDKLFEDFEIEHFGKREN